MANYYVNNSTGDNGNSGALGDEWRNIWYAVTQVSNGDTIWVETANSYADNFSVTGSYPDNVTICSYTPGSPAVIVTSGGWDFDGVDGWTIQDLDFNGYTAQCIDLGKNTAQVTDFTIDGCKFRHSTKASIRIYDCDGLTIRDTLFRDIRSRIVGTGRLAVQVTSFGGYCKDLLMQRCVGEDIGDKTFENNGGGILIDAVIEDCVFGVNRPYSTSGTSFYNGDTTTWQDFSTSVSEAGLDFKGSYGGYCQNVIVRRCSFHGFYETVVGQDASGGNGEGVVIHDDADDITIDGCHVYDCNKSFVISRGTDGTTAGGTITNNFIEACNTYALDFRNANEGITCDDNVVVNSVAYAIRAGNVTFDSFKRNLMIGGDHDRFGTNYGESTFDYNLWDLDTSPPSQWVGSNDLSAGTVKVQRINCMDGGAKIYFEGDGTDLEVLLDNETLEYHPSLSDLNTNFDDTFDAISSSAIAATITEEASERYSIEINW